MSTFSTYNTLIEQKIANTSEVFYDTEMKRRATNDVIKEILQEYDVPEMIVKSKLGLFDGRAIKPSDYFRMVKLWEESGDTVNEYVYQVPDRFDYLDDSAAYYWTEDYSFENDGRVLKAKPRPTNNVDTTSLQMRLDLDEGTGTTTSDSSFNVNNGAANDGTITGADWVAGVSGYGLNFGGVSDLGNVVVSDAASIQDIFDGGGAVAAWIRPRSDGGQRQGQIFSKENASSAGWRLNMSAEEDGLMRVSFVYRFSGTAGIWQTGLVVPKNEWTHVVLTYDADDVANDPVIYINGSSSTVTETSTPVGTRVSDVGTDLYMGSDVDGATNAFDGTMDEFRVYSTTLTAAQAADLAEGLEIRYVKSPVQMDDDSTDSGLSSQWDEAVVYGVASRLFQISNRYDEAREFERLYRDRLSDVYLALKGPGGIKQNNRLKSKYERRSQLGVNSVTAINL